MAHFRAERAKAKALVDHYGELLEGHFEDLRDKEYRAELASSAIHDIVSGIRPVPMIRAMFGKEHGIAGSLLAAFVASKAKGFSGKVLAWAAATIGPLLVDGLLHSEWIERWISSNKEEVAEDEGEEDEGDPLVEDELEA